MTQNTTPNLSQVANVATEPFVQFSRSARIALLAIWTITLVLTGLMWGINIGGWAGANFTFAIISVPIILFAAMSPKVILAFVGLKVMPGDNEKIIGKALLVILYTFGFLAIVLATWSFERSPGAFWGLFAIVQMLLLWQLMYGGKSSISKTLQLAYLVISAILIVSSTTGITETVTEWYNTKDAAEAETEKSEAADASLFFNIAAESGVITLKPAVQTSFKLPQGTLGYRVEVVGATEAERKSESWKKFVAYRATSPNDPNQDDWIGDPAAFKAAGKTEILLKISPTNAETRVRDAMAQ